MQIPEDLKRLLAVAIRDALWYKRSVNAFLRSCGLPQDVLRKAMAALATTPTVQVIPEVLDDLQALGAAGDLPLRKLFTAICNWKDFSSLEADKREQARESVTLLKAAYDAHHAEMQFEKRKAQEEWEKQSQQERTQRQTVRAIDHATLQRLRDTFDEIYILENERERGTRFEALMNEIFKLYTTLSKGAFERTGEQIDGLFYFDNHPYFVEVRWKKKKTNAADISVLRDRANSGFGGDTKALFISFDGFSGEALKHLAGQSGERVVLMDGSDIHAVLEGRIGLDMLLMEKQMDLSKGQRAFVSAYEIIADRESGK